MEVFEQEADFSDLHHVDLAMAGTHDGKHTVEISADLVDSRLVYQVDGETVSTISCKDLSDLNEYLANLDFDEMIAFAEEQYETVSLPPTPMKCCVRRSKSPQPARCRRRNGFP